MNTLTLAGDYSSAFTFVQNDFIDYYMRDINESQIKIYLYLLRSKCANLQVSVSSIADFFNDSERDVIRALKYLDKQKLIALEYDNQKEPSGIRLLSAEESRRALGERNMNSTEIRKAPQRKKSYSAEELSGFKDRKDIKELIYVAETYLKRPLTERDLCSLLYFNEELGFDADLLEYLIEYCVAQKKKSLSLMEPVAQAWARNGITTAGAAKAWVNKAVPSEAAEVLSSFGINGRDPAEAEVAFIRKWLKDYGFSMEIIKEACSRTVLKIQKPSFEYADRILSDWHEKKVHLLSDIEELDRARSEKLRLSSVKRADAPGRKKSSQKAAPKTDYNALVNELMKIQ